MKLRRKSGGCYTPHVPRKTLKNFSKKFLKGIDKGKRVWYNRQAVREEQQEGH